MGKSYFIAFPKQLRYTQICSQKIYQHPSSGTLIVLPGYEQQAYVRTLHLVAVRRILSENGLMDSDRFNSFLNKVAS
ncbi:hypothetical protein [Nostoc sp.]